MVVDVIFSDLQRWSGAEERLPWDSAPREGLAFDRSGSLFVAEIIQTGPGDILKFSPLAASGSCSPLGFGPGGNGVPRSSSRSSLGQPHSARPSPHLRPMLAP